MNTNIIFSRSCGFIFITFLFLITVSDLTVMARSAAAADPDLSPPASEPFQDAEISEDAPLERYGQAADTFQETVSEKLVTSADWLDSFFRDERTEIEENKTNLRIKLSSFFEEGEGIDFKARARLRLVLPRFEDKLHIVFSGESDEDGTDKIDGFNNLGSDDDSEKDINLSLRYFFRSVKKKNISLRVGLRVNEFPPVIYAGPRFSVSRQFDLWLIRFTQNIRYFSDDGWETRSQVDFERPLSDPLFFRTSIRGSWFESDHGYFYEVKNALYQVLDEDRALEYQFDQYLETRPSHQPDQILLRVKYRQRLWRKWLFFEVTVSPRRP
ncbi:hypothetical protein DENIS_4662 [Desulfonema ishimotonii]|uniref:Uncharacterized protein n=1 Tax=Desulfonema ishimotonii TaxID=45657 RepID=A0A401G369_9BACT|nr:hypothetical protein [Desulfonema ishimotonii]GBC63664.1 hypothetical protein DENIS_4662 [Desulfonema ishimotonii]